MKRTERTETNEMICDLRGIYADVGSATMSGGTYMLSPDYFKEVAERLEEMQDSIEYWEHKCEAKDQYREQLEDKIKFLRKRIKEMEQSHNELNISAPESESRSAWNSFEYETEVESNMEIIYLTKDDFPRWIVVTNENGKATHWMHLTAPKQKEPTFKDVFLKAFPKAATNKLGTPIPCLEDIFTNVESLVCKDSPTDCDACWNQPYFEPKEEGEGDV